MENGKKYLEQTIAHLAQFVADHPHSPEIVHAAKAMAELHNALTAEVLGEATQRITDAICEANASNSSIGGLGLDMIQGMATIATKSGE